MGLVPSVKPWHERCCETAKQPNRECLASDRGLERLFGRGRRRFCRAWAAGPRRCARSCHLRDRSALSFGPCACNRCLVPCGTRGRAVLGACRRWSFHGGHCGVFRLALFFGSWWFRGACSRDPVRRYSPAWRLAGVGGGGLRATLGSQGAPRLRSSLRP